MNIDTYYKGIQNFVNGNHREWHRLKFAIFDVFNEDKVTERGLFEFVKYASLKPLDQPSEPTTTLGIDEFAPDIFLDIFANDFYKIIKAFASKRL